MAQKQKELAALPVLGVAFAALLLTIVLNWYVDLERRGVEEAIVDFKECVAAGYHVGESYPRQCFAPGKTFFEEVGNNNPATALNAIQGWKTYRNEQYGFEVKYPKDFVAYSGFSNSGGSSSIILATPDSDELWIAENNGILMSGEPVTISVSVVADTMETPRQWLAKNNQFRIASVSEADFLGYDAIRIEGYFSIDSVAEGVIFKRDQNLFILTARSASSPYREILDSFKLLK